MAGSLTHMYLASIIRDTETSDEEQYTLGIKRAMLLADWDSSARLSFTKSTYGGDDFQRIAKLDIKGRKPISKSGQNLFALSL